MRKKSNIKRIALTFVAFFLLFTIVGCSTNDKEKEEVEKEPIEDNHKESKEELEISIEEEIENDVLGVLGFSEEKDDIVRLGSDDEGSEDQSVTVNEENGSFDLFMAVSKESTGIDSAGDGPDIGLIISHDFKMEKESIPKIEEISKKLFKVISKYEYIDWVGIDNRLLSDDNLNHSKALTINLERETLDRIDWDNFDSNELESIADYYSLDEDLK